MLDVIEAEAVSSEVDFIGASFAGYQEVWQFWESSGYTVIRIGDRIDPVAGEPAMLVLKPLNAAAAEDVLFINQQTTCRYQFERERGLRSAMPMGFNESPDCKDQEVLSSHQIDALKRFAFSNAPLALVRPWIDWLEQGYQCHCIAYLEYNPNKQNLKALRYMVAQYLLKD
jgi:tRNA(Met) C34 N-acetyltransferase TmcA